MLLYEASEGYEDAERVFCPDAILKSCFESLLDRLSLIAPRSYVGIIVVDRSAILRWDRGAIHDIESHDPKFDAGQSSRVNQRLNWIQTSEDMVITMPQDNSGHAFAIRAFCAARTKYPQLFRQNLYTLMRYDYIQPNLVTRHNPGWCPNTDVLCGLPGLLSESLVYSKPGVIELLPAWSPDLPNGFMRGIRCRTQATLNSLEWNLEKKTVMATISSLKDQVVTLYVRQGIKELRTDAAVKPSAHGRIAREIRLQKGEPIHLTIVIDKAVNEYPVNMPAFTLEDAREYHEKRVAK